MMGIDSPLVTVAIPTVDRPEYLKETVNSVLEQTWPSLEILVSDNASGPETSAYLATVTDKRVHKLRQNSRLSMVAHWNECLAKATGEWFLLLSDDDLLQPQAVELLIALAIEARSAIVYSPFIAINEVGVPGMTSEPGPKLTSGDAFIRQHLARKLTVMPSGVLAKTQDLRQLGGFPDIGTTSDLGMRLLLASLGPVACLQNPVMFYRVHDANLSGKTTAVIESHITLLHWAENRLELKDHLSSLIRFTSRRVFGCGLRSAVLGDFDGICAAMRGLDDPSLQLRPGSIRRKAFRMLLRISDQSWFRWVIACRDAWMRRQNPKI